MKKILVILLLLFSVVELSFAGRKNDERDKKNEIAVKSKIENRNYVIDVDRAIPMAGRNVMLTSLYNIKVKGDSLRCYLPYFGRAYSIPYGGGQGLNFDGTITDYKLTYGKRGVAKITFRTASADDRFEFSVDIFPDGSTSIMVQPTNRQSISFMGEMKLDEDKKDK